MGFQEFLLSSRFVGGGGLRAFRSNRQPPVTPLEGLEVIGVPRDFQGLQEVLGGCSCFQKFLGVLDFRFWCFYPQISFLKTIGQATKKFQMEVTFLMSNNRFVFFNHRNLDQDIDFLKRRELFSILVPEHRTL